ncbi:MAG: sulfotransferase [Halioglobus sp.]
MGSRAGKMIFVVGSSRSGTTLLGKILGNHSEVHTFRELQFFENELAADEMNDEPTDKDCLVAIGERLMTSIEDGVFSKFVPGLYAGEVSAIIKREEIESPMELYGAILNTKTQEAGKTISCEQSPRYLFVLGEILDAYPEARAVHVYRDPRAVLLSQKNRWRRAALTGGPRRSRLWTLTSWSNYHPVVTSRFWAAAMRKSQLLVDHPRLTEFSYETMVDEPEATISALCRFLGIEFELGMLDVPVEGSSSVADDPGRRGLDKSRIDSWRKGGLRPAEIEICEKAAGAEMNRLGYSLTGTTASAPQRALIYASLVPKAVTAIALNFRRFSNIIAFLRKRLI